MHVAACFRLVSPLKIQEQQEQEEEQEKGWLMVMADPSDHGHGKKGAYWSWPILRILAMAKQQFSKHRPSGLMLSIGQFVHMCVCVCGHF